MDISSEFHFIRDIAKGVTISDKRILQGIGDDCAVLDRGTTYELISTDTLVSGDHFNLRWATPQQVGRKALEVNVSDIAAMGGKPKYVLVSLVLPQDVPKIFVDGFYEGFYAVCEKYDVSLIGGDTTHGSEISINIAIVGEVSKDMLRLRSGAKVGDRICVTGTLGASTAGLEILRKFGDVEACRIARIPYSLLLKHLEPVSRFDIARQVAEYASAMIDVSDGLASEVRHICEASQVGVRIYADDVPIAPETLKISSYLQKSALDFALSGGEDFELVFTVSPDNLEKMRACISGQVFEVGEIVEYSKGFFLVQNGQEKDLPKGYDHFRQ